MTAPIVFLDIAGREAGAMARFYESVCGWREQGGELLLPVTTPLRAAFRQDPAEERVCILVKDVSRTLNRREIDGGTADERWFETPGITVLGVSREPAGNPIGSVVLDRDRPKVPARRRHPPIVRDPKRVTDDCMIPTGFGNEKRY